MKKLSLNDKKYLKSLQSWEDEQILLVEQMKLNLKYLKDDIELKKKQISLIQKSIVHEENSILRNKDVMDKYK